MFRSSVDMGPSRHPPCGGIPYQVAYDHMRRCRHCQTRPKESCEAYRALAREFERQALSYDRTKTPALGVESMRAVVEGRLR